MVNRHAVLAGFLYEHPGIEVWDHRDECKFWFCSEDGYFYYQKPGNKVLNKPYRARGLDSYLKEYLKKVRGV